MGEGETLPKTNKSKDWLEHADKKLKQFKDYHSERNMIGRIKNPQPLGNDYSKALSQNEVNARAKGMELKRKEMASPSSFKDGGKVRKTGLAIVHKGETVIPAGKRKSIRKSGRR
jgi:hypothetical protein